MTHPTDQRAKWEQGWREGRASMFAWKAAFIAVYVLAAILTACRAENRAGELHLQPNWFACVLMGALWPVSDSLMLLDPANGPAHHDQHG